MPRPRRSRQAVRKMDGLYGPTCTDTENGIALDTMSTIDQSVWGLYCGPPSGVPVMVGLKTKVVELGSAKKW